MELNQPTNNGTQPIDLSPEFDLNNPLTIIKHVEDIKVKSEAATPHSEILRRLVNQFEPLDFKLLAFPQAESLKEKLKQLDDKLINDDGSYNTGKALEKEREEAKDIKKQLESLKLNSKHFLVLSIENALKLAKENNWGLCKNHDFIYLYNGAFWGEIDKDTFQKFLGEAAEKMGIAKFSARFYQFREQLFKQFLATAYLPTPEIDKNKVLINLFNGTFEISSSGTRLRAFESSDFITYQLPFKYNEDAKAPLFEAYLNKVLPDKECQAVLAEYLGYLFIKHGSSLKLEAALVLYGGGANGKSVFFEIINALLGAENVSSYSLQELTDDPGYYRAMIANKLVNYASEINGKLGASKFKQMVSGEKMTARLPYGQPMELTDYAKFIFNCNELPKDVEPTNAYFRRWLIIPFNVTIPKAEQDSELHTKIINAELSGVFNWVLEGLKRLLEQRRFSICAAAQKAVEQYENESNSVQMFLIENDYKASQGSQKLIKELYIDYRSFCTEDGLMPFKKINFIKQLRALNFVVDRGTNNKIVVFIQGLENA
jgi:putative DNA primase/helicase